MHEGQQGLPELTADNRNISECDLVMWHTVAITHLPRPEDWPVMPVEYCGFHPDSPWVSSTETQPLIYPRHATEIQIRPETGSKQVNKTGFVWHERYMWHFNEPASGTYPVRGDLQPGTHVENAETKRKLKNLLDAY